MSDSGRHPVIRQTSPRPATRSGAPIGRKEVNRPRSSAASASLASRCCAKTNEDDRTAFPAANRRRPTAAQAAKRRRRLRPAGEFDVDRVHQSFEAMLWHVDPGCSSPAHRNLLSRIDFEGIAYPKKSAAKSPAPASRRYQPGIESGRGRATSSRPRTGPTRRPLIARRWPSAKPPEHDPVHLLRAPVVRPKSAAPARRARHDQGLSVSAVRCGGFSTSPVPRSALVP